MNATNLLIVDDEPVIRDFLVRILEREGYEVKAASTGREALRWLEMNPFDLLLTDIKMDQMDGVELLHEARSRYPDLVVILLTGHATVPSAVAALRDGASDYLLKPVKNEEILAAVAAGLEKRLVEQRRTQLEIIATQIVDVVQLQDGNSTMPAMPQRTVMLSCGDLSLDAAAHIATLHGERLDLTPTEFRLLSELCRSPGATIEYVRLVQLACGYSCSRQEAREIIGTHVLNLRQKLSIEPGSGLFVESVRGVGYRLIPPESLGSG